MRLTAFILGVLGVLTGNTILFLTQSLQLSVMFVSIGFMLGGLALMLSHVFVLMLYYPT